MPFDEGDAGGVRVPETEFERLRPKRLCPLIRGKIDALLNEFDCFRVSNSIHTTHHNGGEGAPLQGNNTTHQNLHHPFSHHSNNNQTTFGGRSTERNHNNTINPRTGHMIPDSQSRRSSHPSHHHGGGGRGLPHHHHHYHHHYHMHHHHNSNPARDRRGGHGGDASSSFLSRRQPLTPPNKKPVTYERELQSVLNKLTRHNYSKLSASVLDFEPNTHLDIFVATLLEKCYTQTCFLDLFVSLLCDLHRSADADTKTRIDTTLVLFVDQFVRCEDITSFRIRSTIHDYDGFCKDMSVRNRIVGKHRTILALLNQVLLDESKRAVYLHSMFEALDQSVPSHRSDELSGDGGGGGGGGNGDGGECERRSTPTSSDAYELLLDLMMDFVKADASMAQRVRGHFRDTGHFREDAAHLTNRARFKIRDIMATTDGDRTP